MHARDVGGFLHLGEQLLQGLEKHVVVRAAVHQADVLVGPILQHQTQHAPGQVGGQVAAEVQLHVDALSVLHLAGILAEGHLRHAQLVDRVGKGALPLQLNGQILNVPVMAREQP